MTVKPNSKIQSIAIDRNKYTKAEAVSWLKKNHFHHQDQDLKTHYRRFRQINPDLLRRQDYTKFRLKEVTDGIKFIIGYRDSE